LTLALGASTAGFSIVNGILLEPLPFEEPDQLVDIALTRPGRSAVSGFFVSEELLSDGTKPAVISYGYWQGKWRGTPEIIGQTFRLEAQPPMTIIGVLPATFRTSRIGGPPTPVWTTVETTRAGGVSRNYRVVGRLALGESISSAQAEMELIADHLVDGASENERGILVRPLSERIVGA
jgi:hypothetical protein